jgi:hypothetical protein
MKMIMLNGYKYQHAKELEKQKSIINSKEKRWRVEKWSKGVSSHTS